MMQVRHPALAIGGAMFGAALAGLAVWLDVTQQRRTPKQLQADAGEWVTSEQTGRRVCRTFVDVKLSQGLMAIDPQWYCKDWTIAPPADGDSIKLYSDWIRCDGGTCELHLEHGGWR